MDKSDICFDNICRLKRNSYKKFLTKRYNRKLNKTFYNFHNDEINKNELYRKLCGMGYKTQSLVTKTGEISNRGYILDIF